MVKMYKFDNADWEVWVTIKYDLDNVNKRNQYDGRVLFVPLNYFNPRTPDVLNNLLEDTTKQILAEDEYRDGTRKNVEITYRYELFGKESVIKF